MFEDSLVMAKLEAAAPHARWTTISSLVLQVMIAALLFTLPLLRPDSLRLEVLPPAIVVHLPPPLPPVLPRVRAVVNEAAASATSVPYIIESTTSRAAKITRLAADEPMPSHADGIGAFQLSGNATTLDQIVHAGARPGPQVTAASVGSAHSGSVRISSGVAAGMLTAPIRPVYPQLAALSHTEGVVIVAAVISRSGAIEQAHVISGPALLRAAALQAVAAAHYRPFLLNGGAIEVETTITINFRLGSVP